MRVPRREGESLAALALILALAGLYAVIAQSVGQRAKELGVRIALGASGNEVMGLVMRQGMVPAFGDRRLSMEASTVLREE